MRVTIRSILDRIEIAERVFLSWIAALLALGGLISLVALSMDGFIWAGMFGLLSAPLLLIALAFCLAFPKAISERPLLWGWAAVGTSAIAAMALMRDPDGLPFSLLVSGPAFGFFVGSLKIWPSNHRRPGPERRA